MIFSLGTIGLVTDLAFKMTPYSKYRLKLRSLTKHQQKVDDENMWDRCNTISDEKVLSTLGINTINKNIRAELNERSELVLKYLGVLIGVIGAFTGLFAVILH